MRPLNPTGTPMTGHLGHASIAAIEQQCGIPQALAAAKARDIAAGDGAYYVTMPFGQHRGQTLGQILDKNPAYFAWLASGKCTAINGPLAELLSVTGLTMPPIEQADTPRTFFEERIYQLREFTAALDALFATFLKVRTNGKWESTVAEIRQWIQTAK